MPYQPPNNNKPPQPNPGPLPAGAPTIERGIPIPQVRERRGHWKDLAAQMQKGDSVLLATEHNAKALTTWLRKLGGRSLFRATTKGFRVWKVE